MSGLRDWRATLLGLFLAAVIITALITRPAWGPMEFGEFATAIGVALLGLVAKLPWPAEQPTNAPPPAEPPKS